MGIIYVLVAFPAIWTYVRILDSLFISGTGAKDMVDHDSTDFS